MMSNKQSEKTKRLKNGGAIGTFIIFSSLIGFACQSAERTGLNNAASPIVEKKVDDVEDNLKSVQRAGFTFVYTFRRPDGGVLTSEDRTFLKDNSPLETNQWRLTEDEKAVVAGSNYIFPPENLEILRRRFVVEDLSEPVEKSTTQNANSSSSSGNRETTNKNSNVVR